MGSMMAVGVRMMSKTTVISVLTFVVGLVMGSFYNVVALRVASKEKLTYPPSHCTKCGHKLKPIDLIPLLSYMLLKGKCRYCGEEISRVYPIGELLTAIAYLIIINKYGVSLEGFIHIVFITILIIVSITDMNERIVYNEHLIFGLIAVALMRVMGNANIMYYVMSGVVSFVLMLMIFIISKKRLGGGDVKLYALVGLAIGLTESILSFFYASIVGVALNMDKVVHAERREQEIPFVPYILIGVMITYIYNPWIIG